MTEQSTLPPNRKQGWLTAGRVLVIGLVGVVLVLGLILIIMAVSRSEEAAEGIARVNALANSDNECVKCHRNATPGIVEQYGFSTMAVAKVQCEDCHEVAKDYPGAVEHEGTYVLGSPTPARCEQCHQNEVKQYYASRHSIPAYAAMVGLEGLTQDERAKYDAIPEAEVKPNATRNALFAIEGPSVTAFACERCHGIGQPREDGSVGQCQKCHLRHEFSLEQARKPSTCNACHIGPDHPQYEIYMESPHGIAFAADGDNWNWDADPGTLTVDDFPAPTCALCHLSGFGASGTTHDVGDRLTWYLFQPVSDRRPGWQDNLVRMQNVCHMCHNDQFVTSFYTDADTLVATTNQWVTESDAMVAPLQDQGLMTKLPFDEPIDFIYFELWHHWGRTTKFGAWMQGPDYTQWHGAYEMLKAFEELQEMISEKLAGQLPPDNQRVVNSGVAGPTPTAEATTEAAPAATPEVTATPGQ
jgi:hydroxylamine dehydrogenase